tara:strand:- start:106 stop:627 length:522 start_codon:yes stop_codon:yes gene_type:complete
MSLDGIQWPTQVDSELLVKDQEHVIGFLSNEEKGEIDTTQFNDLPITTAALEGTIVDARLVNRDRSGETQFPVLLVRVKTEEWTTSHGHQTSPGYGSEVTLRMAHRALGPKFRDVPDKPTMADMTGPSDVAMKKKMTYMDNLATALKGQAVRVRIRKQKKDPTYNEWSLSYTS